MKFKAFRKNKRAEMGVGTMIIFIAMILVAAVAASVLISTANDVREQAEATGDEAINNVASGFIVQDVAGHVTANQVDYVDLYVKLAAGSPAVDISNVLIISNQNSVELEYVATVAASNDTNFGVDGVGTTITNNVVDSGDLIKIRITPDAATGPGTDWELKIVPHSGSMTTEQFTVPETITGTFISLM